MTGASLQETEEKRKLAEEERKGKYRDALRKYLQKAPAAGEGTSDLQSSPLSEAYTATDHVSSLAVVFQWLAEASLTLSHAKCEFEVDGSASGAGAVLLQDGEGDVSHPVCYFSDEFKRYQLNYITIEKETLAMLLALQHFEPPGSISSSPSEAEGSSKQLLQDPGFESPPNETRRSLASFPKFVEVPGPCDPDDLISGVVFAANYLGCTQLLSEKTPSKNVRMTQAQEAIRRVKAPESNSQQMSEVDLFISTQRIKVLSADTQEVMIDHPLQSITYITDIADIVVLMARRRVSRPDSQENVETSHSDQSNNLQYKMICHVFDSEDAQFIAQAIGQAFSVAYQEFLRANGINPEDLSQKEYSKLLKTKDMYNDDLIHFSKSENCKDVCIEKSKGEILGVVIVESGWGSILPTVIIANMMHAGPAEKSGAVNIGDQLMSVNSTSLVGLPLSTCQSIIKGLKNETRVKMSIVSCPPVTTVLIRRPDLRYQLGFSVQNGIICSLMRGGIAERGGVRVGHRIIDINGQSVVTTSQKKMIHILSNAVGEIHMKTMPAAVYRLLTAQDQPVYI